jgi:DNA-binding transcriptional LysR family regulator
MIIMREVNLRSVDLNLLTVLQALIEERHVTRAAEKLHMSQSAVSRALQRLRVLFNDPLLVKSAEGYTLSSRANKLSTELSFVLQSVTSLIQEPEFDPSISKGVIRFAGIDLEPWIDMSKLVAQLLEEAPKLRIEVSSAQADYFELLSKGRADFVVSGFDLEFDQENIHSCHLGSSGLIAVMGKNNPLSDQELTLDKYLNAKHGYVAITGKGSTFLDSYLQTIGLKREVVLKVSDFKSVAGYCEQSNILFMLPLQLIKSSLVDRDVVIKALPQELHKPDVEFCLFWHARFQNDPLHKWIKEKILACRYQ